MKNVLVVAGRPGSGKTAFLQMQALHLQERARIVGLLVRAVYDGDSGKHLGYDAVRLDRREVVPVARIPSRIEHLSGRQYRISAVDYRFPDGLTLDLDAAYIALEDFAQEIETASPDHVVLDGLGPIFATRPDIKHPYRYAIEECLSAALQHAAQSVTVSMNKGANLHTTAHNFLRALEPPNSNGKFVVARMHVNPITFRNLSVAHELNSLQ